MSCVRSFVVAIFLIAVAVFLQAQSATPVANTSLPADKYQWLEEVHGARSIEWVKAENARTAKILEADPRFATYTAEALKVLEDPSRLPVPDLRGDTVYNLWKDAKNPRGVLRRTTFADYN